MGNAVPYAVVFTEDDGPCILRLSPRAIMCGDEGYKVEMRIITEIFSIRLRKYVKKVGEYEVGTHTNLPYKICRSITEYIHKYEGELALFEDQYRGVICRYSSRTRRYYYCKDGTMHHLISFRNMRAQPESLLQIVIGGEPADIIFEKNGAMTLEFDGKTIPMNNDEYCRFVEAYFRDQK